MKRHEVKAKTVLDGYRPVATPHPTTPKDVPHSGAREAARRRQQAARQAAKLEAAFAAHQQEDPHCTCNDCIEAFARDQEA